jgi:hypothetical protein
MKQKSYYWVMGIALTLINIPYFPHPANLIAFGFGIGILTARLLNELIGD